MAIKVKWEIPLKLSLTGCFTALMVSGWLLVGCAAPPDHAGSGAVENSIPAIAGVAGIQAGYTTMEELEARLGKGKALTGGHPNGAREWRVRGTSWTIRADAFDYSSRGMVVDEFDLRADDQPGAGLPFARLDSRAVGWVGVVFPGTTEDRLLEVLKTKEFPATKTAAGWETSARGLSPLTSTPAQPIRTWTARFEVTNGVVRGIRLDAGD